MGLDVLKKRNVVKDNPFFLRMAKPTELLAKPVIKAIPAVTPPILEMPPSELTLAAPIGPELAIEIKKEVTEESVADVIKRLDSKLMSSSSHIPTDLSFPDKTPAAILETFESVDIPQFTAEIELLEPKSKTMLGIGKNEGSRAIHRQLGHELSKQILSNEASVEIEVSKTLFHLPLYC